MRLIMDNVTQQFDRFLADNAEPIKRAVLSRHLRTKSLSPLAVPFIDSLNQRDEPIQKSLQELEEEISSVCRRHNRTPFLLLFRRVPLLLGHHLSRTLLSNSSKSFAISGVLHDSVLFGTNAILLYSPASLLESFSERYSIDASEEDFRDSYELSILCFLHRMLMFQRNTIARREVVAPVSFEMLIDSYNRRIVDNHRRLEVESLPAIVLPSSFAEPRMHDVSFRRKDGAECTIILRNFLPRLIDAREERERYSHLMNEQFFENTGLSFESAWKIWIALNQVLAESLVFFWSQTQIDNVDEVHFLAAAERADDFTETGLGGGRRSSLIHATRLILDKSGDLDASRDCHKLIDHLTLREITQDIRFIEQPFLFYPLGEDLLLWDYLRHGGFMKAISRRLISGRGGTAGNLTGTYFENCVEKCIRGLPMAEEVQRNVEIRRGSSAKWEIDLGFVVSGILILVEAKHEMKPLRYHFADSVDVAARITRFENRLSRLDEKLKIHKSEVLSRWARSNPTGAICVICTVEVEFIASFSPGLWLDLGHIPRILTPNELTNYLRENVVDLSSHPEFVSFQDAKQTN